MQRCLAVLRGFALIEAFVQLFSAEHNHADSIKTENVRSHNRNIKVRFSVEKLLQAIQKTALRLFRMYFLEQTLHFLAVLDEDCFLQLEVFTSDFNESPALLMNWQGFNTKTALCQAFQWNCN